MTICVILKMNRALMRRHGAQSDGNTLDAIVTSFPAEVACSRARRN